jgi:hypothetical protein
MPGSQYDGRGQAAPTLAEVTEQDGLVTRGMESELDATAHVRTSLLRRAHGTAPAFAIGSPWMLVVTRVTSLHPNHGATTTLVRDGQICSA